MPGKQGSRQKRSGKFGGAENELEAAEHEVYDALPEKLAWRWRLEDALMRNHDGKGGKPKPIR